MGVTALSLSDPLGVRAVFQMAFSASMQIFELTKTFPSDRARLRRRTRGS